MSLTGPMRELARLAQRLDHAANGGLKRAVIARGAGTLAEPVRNGFDTSRKPTGGAWRRLKPPRARSRPNRGGPLVDSGRLREEASTVQITADGWLIDIPRPYAARHQYGDPRSTGRGRDAQGRFTGDTLGGGGIPARPYLPLEAQGLPRVWRVAVEETATGVWRAAFRSV